MKFTDTQRLDYLERLGKEHGWPEQDWNTEEEYELAAKGPWRLYIDEFFDEPLRDDIDQRLLAENKEVLA